MDIVSNYDLQKKTALDIFNTIFTATTSFRDGVCVIILSNML